MPTFTVQSIIDQARPLVDRDGSDDSIANSVLVAWLSPRYFAIRRRIGEIVPDLYKALATYTVAVGASSFVISSQATDFGKILKLEKLSAGVYYPMNVAPELTASNIINGYRFRSGTIDLFPSTGMDGTYVLTYVTKPAAALTQTTDTLDLPDGGDQVLAIELAAMVAQRIDQDGSTLWALARQEWERLAEDLVSQYGASPEGMARIF